MARQAPSRGRRPVPYQAASTCGSLDCEAQLSHDMSPRTSEHGGRKRVGVQAFFSVTVSAATTTVVRTRRCPMPIDEPSEVVGAKSLPCFNEHATECLD